jgi:hypothetical protein
VGSKRSDNRSRIAVGGPLLAVPSQGVGFHTRRELRLFLLFDFVERELPEHRAKAARRDRLIPHPLTRRSVNVIQKMFSRTTFCSP